MPISDYQITQMDLPLCLGGGVPLYSHTYPKDTQKNIVNPGKVVELNRIYLEEDVAKSTSISSKTMPRFFQKARIAKPFTIKGGGPLL